MASFSDEYPFAYHAFPLPRAKPIWSDGRLRPKRNLGGGDARRTTRAVDEMLGFDGFVHFYLPRRGTPVQQLPIVSAQMSPARSPPTPHAVVRLPTAEVEDASCTICCWNIAVSRPKSETAGVKGGNWSRGTRAERIAEVWDAFRQDQPDIPRARGFWHDGLKVPVLAGPQIATNLKLLRKPRRGPELLFKGDVPLSTSMTILVFSDDDEELVRRLGDPPGGAAVERGALPGYGRDYHPRQADLEGIGAYFEGTGPRPLIDFDSVRPGSGWN